MLQLDARLLDRNWPGYAISARGGGPHQEAQAGLAFIFN
jgi:hypothetical protein